MTYEQWRAYDAPSRTVRKPMEYQVSSLGHSGVHSVSGGTATHLPILLANPRETQVRMVAAIRDVIGEQVSAAFSHRQDSRHVV